MRKMKKMVFKHAIEQVRRLRGKRPKSKRRVLNAVSRVQRADVVGISVERRSASATHPPHSLFLQGAKAQAAVLFVRKMIRGMPTR